MIPKIVHLCWLSDDKYPPLIQKCIDSWIKILPDYEIKIWNAKTFDIHSVQWVSEAYNEKKYAFAADYIRFYALYNYGGIYLDSDVEVLKKFDNLLSKECFFGFEYTGIPEAAVVGAEPGLKWIEMCKSWYEKESFYNPDGTMRQTVVPFLIKCEFEKFYDIELLDKGVVLSIGDTTVFPYKFFSPKNFYSNQIKIYDETYCIHHSVASWVKENKKTKFKRLFHIILIGIFGKKVHDRILRSIHRFKLALRKRKTNSAF